MCAAGPTEAREFCGALFYCSPRSIRESFVWFEELERGGPNQVVATDITGVVWGCRVAWFAKTQTADLIIFLFYMFAAHHETCLRISSTRHNAASARPPVPPP